MRSRALLTLALFSCFSCSSPRIETATLIGKPFVLGPDWTEVELSPPIAPKWLVSSVVMELGEDRKSVRLDSNESWDVELVSDRGRIYRLGDAGRSFSDDHVEMKKDSMEPSQGERLVRLRMRSLRARQVLKVEWRSYMPEDFKGGTA